MELYIPHTFFNTKAKNPWLNSTCSRTVKDRETAHKRYRCHPSAETHALYFSANRPAKPRQSDQQKSRPKRARKLLHAALSPQLQPQNPRQ